MEIQNRKNVSPWMWVGIIALVLLFCCCSIIVALAIFGPMLSYYSSPPGDSSGFMLSLMAA
jgi:hypothetical protein